MLEYLLNLAIDPSAWIALATLIAMEVVLGIDNLIFISVLTNKLPAAKRHNARRIGIGAALILRLLLLGTVAWIIKLTYPVFEVFGKGFSWRDLILIAGGLFLLAKATHEIHNSLEGAEEGGKAMVVAGLGMVLVQIAVLDIVFSLDSVITAVGLVDHVSIMAIAIVLAVVVMLIAAEPIGDFVDRHPTVKILALSFLILVGVTLMVEGFDVHVPKGYIYFAMAFSVAVEMLNIRMRRTRAAPVKLHKPMRRAPESA